MGSAEKDNGEKGRQWFAVRTKPRQEAVAGSNYRRQGFSVYAPVVQAVRRHARKTEEVLKPFFPGYIFLHLAPEERRWPVISSTIGALTPVKFGEYYPPVPDWVIGELKKREDGNGIIPFKSVAGFLLRPGAKVKVSLGAGQEKDAIFRALHGRDRAVILLDILSRQVSTVVPVMNLITL